MGTVSKSHVLHIVRAVYTRLQITVRDLSLVLLYNVAYSKRSPVSDFPFHIVASQVAIRQSDIDVENWRCFVHIKGKNPESIRTLSTVPLHWELRNIYNICIKTYFGECIFARIDLCFCADLGWWPSTYPLEVNTRYEPKKEHAIVVAYFW